MTVFSPEVRIRPGSGPATLLPSLPPLSVYVHVPWCVRKCPYCDFNSHEAPAELPENEYLDALQADLEQTLPLVWGRQVISVFIGGGTPSLLSAQALDRMLALLRSHLNLLPDAEITLEANPGASEASRFMDFAQSGVNRISLGIQSFNDQALKALGRIHDSQQARQAIEAAMKAVERVNLDIMYALPGQTPTQSEQDIVQAMSYETEHLSLYHLTLEPNTVFAKYPPALPDDDDSAAMQDRLIELTASRGWNQYEISAYSKRGGHSRHNLNYWEFGDYIGIGPGAHGKLSFHDRIIRTATTRSPTQWMQNAIKRDGSHYAHNARVMPKELPFEFMLNVLRLKEGVPAQYFQERTGIPLAQILPVIKRNIEKGLLAADPVRVRTTDLGWRFLNDLQESFLPDEGS
ncbi:MAG: radical SAM family heme chaperone HemW [Alcaligenes faecalis]|uniref:Heme chaperone HemW n=1 Tax=Alcaligenes aquatilis TaxID=323284 RepID=A0ABY4NL77_9BURK|nr:MULTISPECIES: radical SAM family heme chaperone HemW [Alcaligenes]MCC9162658.1 radical SAM family heme chaperone HemW [Alcaligenes sp. MMA]MCH4223391.1 radical SAM family heme chaperone HemW [Alcaligenes faecalis]UQN37752.1 radical SAM family heme chaperone HemW [Alcaligenes aquatilis]UYY89032.1 radical SAM family heme chaperone HemW [Alcaligenes sp. SMD-FA]